MTRDDATRLQQRRDENESGGSGKVVAAAVVTAAKGREIQTVRVWHAAFLISSGRLIHVEVHKMRKICEGSHKAQVRNECQGLESATTSLRKYVAILRSFRR
jgi:hypothetical protein